MTVKKIKTVAIIGSGTMGRGIAQVFALYNYPVTLIDREESILRAALEKVRERTAPDMWGRVSGLIKTSTHIESVKDHDLIIEAVFEDMDVKKEVFRALDKICKRDAIIATNTSALSINELAKALSDPSRFIGMHFMNPPKAMKLVEIIRGRDTSKETVDAVTETTEGLEKITALVNDSPGFISNRLLFALIGEALRLLEAGAAEKEAIDAVMKHGMNHPMGPIELADFIGLDVCAEIMEYLYRELEDARYRPTERLSALVRQGKLGRKTGEGFYVYG